MQPDPSYQYRKDIAKAIAAYRASLRSSFKRYGEPIPLSRDCELAFNYAWLTCKFAIDKAGQQLDNARSHLGKGAHYGPYYGHFK